jgi:hypothetical protein
MTAPRDTYYPCPPAAWRYRTGLDADWHLAAHDPNDWGSQHWIVEPLYSIREIYDALHIVLNGGPDATEDPRPDA